jgi:hypothetical protein
MLAWFCGDNPNYNFQVHNDVQISNGIFIKTIPVRIFSIDGMFTQVALVLC